VSILAPVAADLTEMGPNLMNPKRRTQVLQTALDTVSARLAGRLPGQPLGDAIGGTLG
jgi:hypothetical protein